MKTVSSRWGWLAFGLGTLALILTWFWNAYALFCWGWVLCSLSVTWLALIKLRLGPTQWLIVGASLMNAAAGVCNGLVMAANGMRMPAEPIDDWRDTPSFLDSPEDEQNAFCRMVRKANDSLTPSADTNTHFDVPTPRIVRGWIPTPSKPPRLAFLDDRHGIRLCGKHTVYSKGDMLGFIGCAFLGVPGLVLLVLGFIWRRIRRKRSAPTGR